MELSVVTQGAKASDFTNKIFKSEPPNGTLPTDASVLVDDGTCPAGRIKRVVGGDQSTGKPRIRSCVPKSGPCLLTMRPLIAHSGHPQLHHTCLLSGVKRTTGEVQMSAFADIGPCLNQPTLN